MRKWLERLIDAWLMLPWRGQPVVWTKRGLMVKPRTKL